VRVCDRVSQRERERERDKEREKERGEGGVWERERKNERKTSIFFICAIHTPGGLQAID